MVGQLARTMAAHAAERAARSLSCLVWPAAGLRREEAVRARPERPAVWSDGDGSGLHDDAVVALDL